MKNIEVDRKKEFEKLFEKMCYDKGLSRKDAWSDLMLMFACTISNATEPYKERFNEREETYMRIEERLGGKELPAQMLATLILALNENPNQDFLGEMYMRLSMAERAWGQVFTPYHISEMMAMMVFDNPESDIEDHGYVSTCDPCVGAGAMIIASAQAMRTAGYDVSSQMVAVGQDIDLTVVCMAYVQLSALGIPAVIVHGDSLMKPYTGNPMFIEDRESHWYTPALFANVWYERRVAFIEEVKRKAAA